MGATFRSTLTSFSLPRLPPSRLCRQICSGVSPGFVDLEKVPKKALLVGFYFIGISSVFYRYFRESVVFTNPVAGLYRCILALNLALNISHWNDIQHQGNGPVHLVGSHCVERMMEDRDELGEEEEAEDDDDTSDEKTANKKSKDKA